MKIFPCLASVAYRKISVILLVLLLAGIAMAPIVGAADPVQRGNERYIDISKAESVALMNIREVASMSSEYESWKDATVVLSTTYYDLNDEKTAYAFDVLTDMQYAGYIIVSATQDNYPALELSRGERPGEKASARSRSAHEVDSFAAKKGFAAGSHKPVYLGGTFFYEKYELVDTNNKKQMDVIVDLNNHKVIDLADESAVIPVSIDKKSSTGNLKVKSPEIKKQWDLQDSAIEQLSADTRTVTGVMAKGGTSFIDNVPNYAWYIGCSPTASAMVLGYWKNMGYSNYPSGPTLIAELASAMGTSQTWPLNGATWPWNIASGINTVSSNHGYSYIYSFSRPDDAWATIKSEIDADRPFVISMLHGGVAADSNTNQAYGEHSVACIGYMEGTTTENRWVTIYDTWDTGRSHLLQYQNWWNAQETYVRP